MARLPAPAVLPAWRRPVVALLWLAAGGAVVALLPDLFYSLFSGAGCPARRAAMLTWSHLAVALMRARRQPPGARSSTRCAPSRRLALGARRIAGSSEPRQKKWRRQAERCRNRSFGGQSVQLEARSRLRRSTFPFRRKFPLRQGVDDRGVEYTRRRFALTILTSVTLPFSSTLSCATTRHHGRLSLREAAAG